MAEYQNDNIFEEVNSKANIVDVVRYYLGPSAVTKKGKVYYAICPFHNDTHPSFRIDPEKNLAYCFTCNNGGKPVKFVMLYAKLNAFDAARKVCEICSIPFPKELNQNRDYNSKAIQYKKEYEALQELQKIYEMNLRSTDGKPGMDYLQQRQIPLQVAEKFHIGYAIDDDQISIRTLRGLGYEVRTLENAGILSNSTALTDRYTHRLMFPLEDHQGRVVGFSGRVLSKDQDSRKYINSPETVLFQKKDILYHYHDALPEARKKGYLYIVEGFMDVIALVRAGEEAVVGLMGVALTKEHCELFKRLEVEIRMSLDSDEAGQSNTEKSLQLLYEQQIPVRVVRKLKKAKDADELLTQFGPKEVVDAFNRMYDPFLFMLGRVLRGRRTMTDTSEINNFILKNRKFFKNLSDVSKAYDLNALANVTGLDKEDLRGILLQKKDFIKPNELPKEKKTYREWKKKDPVDDYEKFKNVQIKTGSKIAFDVSIELRKMLENSSEVSGIFNEIVKTECDLICAIPYLKESMRLMVDNHIDFAIPSIAKLSDLFLSIYIENPDKDSLNGSDFDKILKNLSAESDGKTAGGMADDLSDFFEIDDDLPSATSDFSPEERSVLASMIQLIRMIPPNSVDLENFERNLRTESHLLAIYNMISKSKRDNGKVTPEVKMECQKYMRRNRIRIVSQIFK